MKNQKTGDRMLWTIAVILVILWLLGFVGGYMMDGAIHVLLLAATVVVVIRESYRNEEHFSDVEL